MYAIAKNQIKALRALYAQDDDFSPFDWAKEIQTETVVWQPQDTCTCPTRDLAAFGCKCGYIKRERERAGK